MADIPTTTIFSPPFSLVTKPPLPLTTTFTPAIECLTDWWVFQSSWSGYTSRWANLGPENTGICLPSGWAPSTWYSPGIACPSGWAMASGPTTVNGETTGTCCPVYLPSDLTFTPRSSTSGGDRPWHSFEVCAFGATSDMKFIRTNTNKAGTTRAESGTAVAGKDGWNAYGIELRWRTTDLISAPATSREPTATHAVIPTTTQQPLGESTSLSTGAKAGIGIGAAIGGILAILGVVLLLIGRRKHQGKNADELREDGQHELDADENQIHELGSNHLLEADDSQMPSTRSQEPAELDNAKRPK
ncbi:hypothetical protein PEX1_088270 [Penicillium expansum]|uniref:Uncharacterized protein n=1 Tax=Penicillium expansum TaxID=27334 RepID=A0A0A2IKZ8_PENEN|nr:hypothetical protein PEX2_047730 [Penicillium expansum]KGO38428.1 hypothetical protein PEXP_056270 [Penicillium expansum]KGO43724.1 hypothetical protein PEX1_088270 [Penicillium expansum]KGO52874.1 hypothetical protein PEX2_047730 [Penicillium expansum]